MSAVDVIVVTHDSAGDLVTLLPSLDAAASGLDLRVTVVDNASTDDTRAVAQRWAADPGRTGPPATVVASATNDGFAAAVNRGIATGRHGAHVLVLNADVVVPAGALPPLVDAVSRPGVGIAAPVLVRPVGSTERLQRSVRRPPTALRAWGDALLGGDRAGRVSALGETVVDPAAYRRELDAGWVVGAAMLVARPCLDAIGPLDESFFLYSEDTEYCLRARAAGFRCLLVPASVITHAGGESHDDPSLRPLLARNRIRLYHRSHGRLRTLSYGAAVVTNEALRAVRGREECRASTRALLHLAGQRAWRRVGSRRRDSGTSGASADRAAATVR